MFGNSHVSQRRHVRTAARRAAAVLIEPVERRTLMSAGTLDPTFGTAGTLANDGDNDNYVVTAPDAKGREVVAFNGMGIVGGYGATLQRLNANGSIDPTFATKGTFAVGLGPGDDDYRNGTGVGQVISLPNGDTLLTAAATIQELTPNGALDTRFGGGGPNNIGKGSSYLYPYPIVSGESVAVQADGKLIVAGETATGGTFDVVRYNADGSIDTRYGTAGLVTVTPRASGSSYLGVASGSVTLDSAGRAIVSFVAGMTEDYNGRYTSAVDGTARLTANGQVDASYGSAGFAVTPVFDNLTGPSTARAPDGTLYQEDNSQDPSTYALVSHLFVYSADGKHVATGVVNGPGAVTDIVVGADAKPVLSTSDGRVDRLLPIDPAASTTAAIEFDPTWAASGSAAIVYPPPDNPMAYSSAPFDANSISYDAEGNLIVSSGGLYQILVSRLLTAGPSAVVPVAATGRVIGSAGSYANRGNTVAEAFDGNLGTFYDAAHASGDWAGLDLGTAAKPIVQIQFAPRSGFAARMVGGQFQVSSTPDFSSGVHTIYTVTAAPPVGTLTTVAVGDVGTYQYVRYLGPAGSYGNIAEMKVLVAGPTQMTGTVIGTAGSYRNQGNTIADAFDGNVDTFVDAAAPSGSWAGLDLGYARSVSQIHFAPRVGFAARMVGGQFQGSNTPNFSSGVTTLYTVTAVPAVGQLTTVTVNSAAAGLAFRYVRYVGPTGGYGNIAEAEFFSGPPLKQTGTVIGTDGSYNNLGNTIANAFDGNLNTYVDLPSESYQYVGLDFGTGVAVTQVKIAPRAGYASRMVGGMIVASNFDPSQGIDVSYYTITSAPTVGVLTTITLPTTAAYQYWAYIAPDGSYGNIAELEFDA